ncbi:MAG: homocysteine S-methyltransferase family protein [Anaerolineae bacterium]
MAKSFVERLTSGDILVADGATGTNLQAMGLPAGAMPEEWVFDAPDNIIALHRAFLDAGSDIVLTCTFGATRLRMHSSRYADRVPEVNRRAVELAREAAASYPGAYVAGSIGPTGMLMEPLGALTHEAAVANFAEQAEALTAGGVDFLLLETQTALEEALAAIEGIRQVSNLPLVVSFSYDRGTRTMMGVRPQQAVAAVVPLGVVAVGANCGKTLDTMEQIVAEMASATTLPLWVKPNAGLPHIDGDALMYDVTPDDMAEYTTRFLKAGARVVGGCCGSSPAHVAAIARAAEAYRGEPELR